MKRQIIHLILALFIFLLAAPNAVVYSRTYKDVTMEDTLELDGQKLVLNGMALRKKMIFKVYIAGLYLPQQEKDWKKILESDTPRHMIMHFVRTVGANKISDAWMEGLEENTPNASTTLKQQFRTLCNAMEEVKDGERIIFSYIPGKGTTILVKNKEKGVIPDKAFADALFACWIGPNPGPGQSFKEDLLGIE